MYRFQASVHNVALQAFCLQQARGALCRDSVLGADVNERGPRPRIVTELPFVCILWLIS
jgi:hypothetical protein